MMSFFLSKSKNLRWQLMLYFFTAALITMIVTYVGWVYLDRPDAPLSDIWFGFIILLLLNGIIVGLAAGRSIQHKLDALHLGIIQIAKGGVSYRIPFIGNDSFQLIYDNFNDMAAFLETRFRLLQQMGEEDVLQKSEANELAVLEERRRLARDLHDSVSQQLFAIHMAASSLPKMLESNADKAAETVSQLIHISNHAQKQLRSLIAQLRPLELEGKSLSDALDKWFPDYCRQNGLQGSLEIQLKRELSEGKEHQLFLIVQEGMANIVKHAHANKVSLALLELERQYVLSISDDGVGFDRLFLPETSYGLKTMQERAQKLGGETDIWSAKGSGTKIKVTIPKFK